MTTITTPGHGAVLAAMAAAADAKRAWLAVQTEPSARHAAADEYDRARRAAFIAVDQWIDQTAT